MRSPEANPVRPLVIAGLPRCGTTLLATFLASQSHVSFLTDYVTSFSDAATHLGIEDWRTPLSSTQRRIALAIVRDELLRFRHPVLLGIDDFESLRELHEGVLGELARPGDRMVGHKLLASAEQIRHLLEQTANRVVVLYRDPRDAALSFFHRTGGGVEAYLDRWRRVVRLVASEDHPRLFAIRYESLVSSPEQHLRPVFQTFGLEIDTTRAALVFDRAGAGRMDWPGNATFEQARRAFDSRALERWRSVGSSPIVRYAEWTCRRELRLLGYAEGASFSFVEAAHWRAHEAVHTLARRADRGWERGRARVVSLAAPPLRS